MLKEDQQIGLDVSKENGDTCSLDIIVTLRSPLDGLCWLWWIGLLLDGLASGSINWGSRIEPLLLGSWRRVNCIRIFANAF